MVSKEWTNSKKETGTPHKEEPVDFHADKEAWAKKVKEEFQKHVQDNMLPPELGEEVFDLPKSRLNSHSNRSYFVKSIADYILRQQNREQEWEQYEPLIVKLALCSEIMITVQYYHNYIFDGKAGVTTPLLIRETLIKANLLKSWLFRYIDTAFSEHGYDKLIRDEIDRVFNLTDIGQYIEGRYNSFEYYKRSLNSNELIDHYEFENQIISIDWSVIYTCINLTCERIELDAAQQHFIKMYFLRLYLTGSVLYETYVDVLSVIFNCTKTISINLQKFASYYGIMMQVVNDNNDFVPSYMEQDTKAKFPQDQQCDIRNKNITLPLSLYLCSTPVKGVIWDYLNSTQNSNYNEKIEKEIFENILSTLNDYTIPIGEKIVEFANKDVFFDKKLTHITIIASNNRFYTIIYNQHKLRLSEGELKCLNHDRNKYYQPS